MTEILKKRISEKDLKKLGKIKNQKLHQFITKFIELCNPDEIFVSDDSAEDIRYLREEAVRGGEEQKLATDGHTLHFDSYHDQARDRENTKFLLKKGTNLGPNINATDKEEGVKEVYGFLKNIMQGRKLYICFYCLGPTDSIFSIPCVQLTDSSYVAHSETLLYRPGYKQFIKSGDSFDFFKFVHSSGELDGKVSKNVEKRRVYIDIDEEIVYSVNTQYGGNVIGLKKLAMRLAIKRASKEKDWLTEHMFLMGINGPGKRRSYFTGAYPSLCGKTSTAMMEDETILGDDIAYLRRSGNEIRAVNVEKGMFGIIQGINSTDDPLIWNALTNKGEIIFSNILLTKDKNVYWIGKDGKMPDAGVNHSGEWTPGKKDAKGIEITPSHKNARFTIALNLLGNLDPELDNPKGVVVGGIVYGGRDSDTWVPVEESFDWTHGIVTKGASLESETTAAALGKEGVRKFNPMANLDFLSVSIGKYIQNNLDFGASLKKTPPIFSVNYFLKGSDGKFLNERGDKRVWFKWMELRLHNDVDAIKTPTGLIPTYDVLKKLFKQVLGKDYTQDEYNKQFTLRIPQNLAKIERIIDIYKTKVLDTPEMLFRMLEEQKKRLLKAQKEHGDYILPDVLKGVRN